MSNFAIGTADIYSTKILKFPSNAADKVSVKTRLPKLILIWSYDGEAPEARRAIIDALDYPDFEVIFTAGARSLSDLAASFPADSEVCVFWQDDGKAICPNFLRDMVEPLKVWNGGADPSLPVMHLWSGNALAMRCGTFYEIGHEDFVFEIGAFHKMTLLFLDARFVLRKTRSYVAFTPTEQLAPMSATPVGLPS